MKRLLLIVLPLFISVGYSQKFVHTETFGNGNIKSLTSHKETRNRIEKVKYVEYYRNGQKKGEGTYKDGKENGLHIMWWNNGQKRGELNYKDGEIDGLWTWWYENGQKRKETTYKDGKYISKKEWNEDGSVEE